MQQIINFLIKNKTFLLFLLLFSFSVFLTFQSHSYHKSKFINSANFLTGGIYKSANNIKQYFGLKEENEILLEENNRLKSILFNIETEDSKPYSLNKNTSHNYKLIAAQVYKNSYSATNNYLTINKGIKDSIKQDLGVITSNGIIGIIDNTSKKYARVMSILNTNSRINVQLKRTNHFGILKWDTKSPQIVQLNDIPKLAPVTIVDTVITGGRSTIFPKGIPVGKIVSFQLDETQSDYIIDIKLFNDMTNLGHVFIIENLDAKEILNLNHKDE